MARPDIEAIFREYADPASGRLTPERLADFFRDEQKQPMGKEECAAIIQNHEPEEDKTTFSQLGFQQFLMFSDLQVLVFVSSRFFYRNSCQNFQPFIKAKISLYSHEGLFREIGQYGCVKK
jgi:hypothetical protein